MMKHVIKFYGYKGKYGFLSNFYMINFEYNGNVWKSSEYAFQAEKTVNKTDFYRVKNADNSATAKFLGRECLCRLDWEEVKDDIMFDVCMAKFENGVGMAKRLLNTGDSILIENSKRDYYWGCGEVGSGKNKLGKILMDVREWLKD